MLPAAEAAGPAEAFGRFDEAKHGQDELSQDGIRAAVAFLAKPGRDESSQAGLLAADAGETATMQHKEGEQAFADGRDDCVDALARVAMSAPAKAVDEYAVSPAAADGLAPHMKTPKGERRKLAATAKLAEFVDQVNATYAEAARCFGTDVVPRREYQLGTNGVVRSWV